MRGPYNVVLAVLDTGLGYVRVLFVTQSNVLVVFNVMLGCYV